ncbi:hypothetical protein DFH09DRAFT_1334811 [Mycena vulgaris]|nr:hypothetical protein DFH09DRAFT_1334811 [Mycena vulgaris]
MHPFSLAPSFVSPARPEHPSTLLPSPPVISIRPSFARILPCVVPSSLVFRPRLLSRFLSMQSSVHPLPSLPPVAHLWGLPVARSLRFQDPILPISTNLVLPVPHPSALILFLPPSPSIPCTRLAPFSLPLHTAFAPAMHGHVLPLSLARAFFPVSCRLSLASHFPTCAAVPPPLALGVRTFHQCTKITPLAVAPSTRHQHTGGVQRSVIFSLLLQVRALSVFRSQHRNSTLVLARPVRAAEFPVQRWFYCVRAHYNSLHFVAKL